MSSVTVIEPALQIDAALDSVRVYNKTGVDHMKQGRMQEALGAFHAALTIISRAVSTSESTRKQLTSARAATLNNIGCLFKRTDKAEDALRCLMEARDLEVEANGAASCSTMLNLCTVLVTVGSVENALVVAKECVKQAEGDDYLYVVGLHNLAVTQQSSNDPSEKRHATTSMLRALAESRKRLGEEHPTTNLIREKCGLAAIRPAIPPRAPAKKSDGAHREFARQALRSLDFATSEVAPPVETRGGSINPAATAAVTEQQGAVDVTRGATFTSSSRHGSAGESAAAAAPQGAGPAEKEQTVAPVEQTIVLSSSQPAAATSTPSPPPTTAPSAAVSTGPAPASATEQTIPSHSPATRRSSTSRKPIYQQIQDERLRLKKRSAERSESGATASAPSFTRFAPPTGTTLPIPVSFADVRDELKIARLAQQNAEAAQVWIERARDQQHTTVVRQNAAPVLTKAQALANKKRMIREEEELEEKRLRERKAREDELAMLQKANAERQARLRDQERHRAAVTIQRFYRHWWNTVGFKTHMARMQTTVKRSQSKVSLQATAVAKCARKWLNKTAGRRLIIRLGGARKNDFQRVVYCVEKIQRAWRYAIARLRVSRKASARLEDRRIRVTIERRHLAATRIQSTYRMHRAVNALKLLKSKHYWRHVCVLQKWWRKKLDQRLMSGARASRTFGRTIAATTIQRYWRGYMDRLRAAILRIQRKVAKMRESEKKSAQRLQRVGRAFVARRWLLTSLKNPAAHSRGAIKGTNGRSGATSAASVVSSASTRASASSVVNSKKVLQIPAAIQSTYNHLSILQGINEAARIREVERDNQHMEIAVQAQLERVVADYTHPAGAAVRLQRTTEDYRRSVELQRLMRLRAARLIQRTFRRWLYLRFNERERTLPLTRAIYAEKAARRKSENLSQAAEKERLHSLFGDPARDARELKRETMHEIEVLRQAERRPEEEPFEQRDWTQRKVAVREVKSQEALLAKQMASVREASLGRTFITAKEQRRLLMLSQERSDGEAGDHQQPLAAIQ